MSQKNDLLRTIHSAGYEFCRAAAIWPVLKSFLQYLMYTLSGVHRETSRLAVCINVYIFWSCRKSIHSLFLTSPQKPPLHNFSSQLNASQLQNNIFTIQWNPALQPPRL